jgi:alkaline phosphatase D
VTNRHQLARGQFENALVRSMSRRRLLVRTGLAASLGITASLPGRASVVLGQGTPAATPGSDLMFSSSPFTLGVASGDPLPDGVVLWTRLAPTPLGGGGMPPVPVEVRWEIAADDTFSQVVQSGSAIAAPNLAHSVHVDLTGLAPTTEYFYRFMAGGEVSPIGRTLTAPAAGAVVDQIRFAHASCSNYEHGYFTGYRGIAVDRPDFVLHLGDYIYEYPAKSGYVPSTYEPVRSHASDEPTSLNGYRNRHATYKTDPDLQAAHAAAPWIVTWDDHEVENNYADAVSEDDAPTDTFLERRAAAYQAYYEHMPLRPSSLPTGPDMQLYRGFQYGSLLDVAMLDGRQYRSDQPCGDNAGARCPQALDPAMTMLGPEQEQWVLATLDASQATWRTIGQQTMMAQLNVSPIEPTFNLDQWDGYPAARNRFLQHIGSREIANTVILTGDIHSAWVNDLKMDFEDVDSATVATEFVCTSITADNPLVPLLQQALLINPHIKYVDGLHGYTLNTVTPDDWTAEFRTVPNVTDETAAVTTRTTWVVTAGQAGAEEA